MAQYVSRYGFVRGQKVEFDLSFVGFPGIWIPGLILDIRQLTNVHPEELLLQQFDVANRFREIWVNVTAGNPPSYMVRPVPPLFHAKMTDSEVITNLPVGRNIYVNLVWEGCLYDDNYVVGEMVEIPGPHSTRTGHITSIDNRTGHVVITLFQTRLGGGGTQTVPKNALRPAMSWSSRFQWRIPPLLGNQLQEPQRSNCTVYYVRHIVRPDEPQPLYHVFEGRANLSVETNGNQPQLGNQPHVRPIVVLKLYNPVSESTI